MANDERNRRRFGLKRTLLGACASACLLLGATAVQAQAAKGADAWKYQFDLFAWGTGLSGTVGPEMGLYSVDASFGDITKYLDFASMGHFEATRGRWGVMADLFYVDLGHSVDDAYGNPVKLGMQNLVLGLGGTYRLYGDAKSTFDFVLGARYNEVKSDITPYLLPSRHSSLSWTDPVVGLKGGVRLGKVWSFGYRVDVGGFGAGSNLACLAAFRFDAQLSRSVALNLGYICYKVDYEEKNGASTFVYDTLMQGPALGVSFRW
jgi:hypothetical protein